MAKKGNRLREFEKNHRVLDISTAQAERQKESKNKGKESSGEQRRKEEDPYQLGEDNRSGDLYHFYFCGWNFCEKYL